MSRVVPIHEAKAKLSALLREVKRGCRITISERGRPIAMISPLEEPRDAAARIRELAARGVIVPASSPPSAIRPVATHRGALRRFLRSRN